ELWSNIAWAVLAGLGWLVILHLRHLKTRHYESWDALAERPFELLLPAMVVIGVLVALGVMMPRAPVLLEDPYTLWMESQNKEVPSLGGEGGFLITGSSVSSGSSGSTKSGYGRSDSQIGGGFQFDYSPVMEVTTTQRSYWRGETKAVYTGKGWTDRKGMETVPADVGSKEPFPLTPVPVGEKEGFRKVEQTVKMIRKDKVPVLFAAGPVADVQEIEGAEGAKLFWNPEEWELRFQRPAQVTTYTVESEVQELDENRLRQLSAVPANGQASIDLAPYLQLPDSLPARVGELAKQVTKGASDDYDRLKMLETYLQTTYPYTNTPDTSKQHSKDVVDAFLFEIQEGYCDYYSTAFVVMARTLGLPTRWVKGYATGTNPQDEERARYGAPADPDGAGTYTVRNADAHSWAEAYFEGYGWVPFEPTAGFSIPVIAPKEDPTQAALPADTTVVAEPEQVEAPSANWQKPVAISAGAAVLALAALLLFFKRRSLLASWRRLRHRGATPNQRIVREMERFVARMNRRGLKRSRHETLRETFSGWGSRFGSIRSDLEGALQQFEAARYGGEIGDEEAYERFAQTVEKIRKAL
ncbi:transglutaminase domain-containing protein, partial [Cohnella zeiphila]